MLQLLTNFFKALCRAVYDTINHSGVEYSGYLAFLLILSIFPAIFITSAIASCFVSIFKLQPVTEEMLHLLYLNIPSNITQGLRPYIREIVSGPPQSLLTFAIGGAAWTASSTLEGARTILNKAYRVTTTPPYLLRRLISIVEFFIVTLGIAITVIFLTVAPSVITKLAGFIKINDLFLLYTRYIFSITILILAVCILYIIVPNLKQKFFTVLPGSILVVLLWVVSANIFSFYIKTVTSMNLIYGGLAGIIIALLFFYIISLCFILGAEFNYNLNNLNKR